MPDVLEMLTDREAAPLLGLSPHTLARWRWAGRGPQYVKLGKAVRYRRCDLIAFAEAHLKSNTSEPAHA